MKMCKICKFIWKSKKSINEMNKSGCLTLHFNKHNIDKNDIEKYIENYEKKCKICDNFVKDHKHIYCSNKCKFSDKELSRQRGLKNIPNDKNKELKCKLCEWTTSDINNYSGRTRKHLIDKHNIVVDTKEYIKHYDVINVIEKEKLKCPMCDWTTIDIENKSGWFSIHLNRKHALNIDKFINKFPEYKNLWKIHFKKKEREYFLKENKKNRIQCLECNKIFGKLVHTHLKLHKLTPTQYKIKYDIITTNSQQLTEIQSEITTKHNLLYGNQFSCFSSDEIDFIKKLKKCNIKYIHQFLYGGRKFDIYLPKLDIVIEVDGIAYHSDKLENINMTNIRTANNDMIKNKIMENVKNDFKFYRIRYDKNIFNFNNENQLIELLEKNKYIPDYTVKYKQKIIIRDHLLKCVKYIDRLKLKVGVNDLLKFIKIFHPQFPYPEQEENLNDIINIISNYDMSRIFDDNNTFKNNISTIGNNYLKSNFKSYWHSRFNKNVTPIQAWTDDELMKKVIEYRIGLNDSNEIFDFSLHQLIRGISARRITISFFKPLLAACIYKTFLGNKNNPIVIDTCAGFGGRMLGFKSIYPNGKYIGIEPNIETYNELKELAKNFNNIELYNCKLEDYNGNKNCDLTFTSIPYFDTEIYSNNIIYNSFGQWNNTFIKNLLTYNNLLINIPFELESLFTNINKRYYITNNTSHFNNKNNLKQELLLKLS